jgi:hypothetical protein
MTALFSVRGGLDGLAVWWWFPQGVEPIWWGRHLRGLNNSAGPGALSTLRGEFRGDWGVNRGTQTYPGFSP